MKRFLVFVAPLLFLVAAGCTKVASPEVVPDYQSFNQPAQVHVTQTVQGNTPNETAVIAAGKTALDVLKQSYKVETKTFSGAGEFVNSINGVAPDAKHFWAFYVNGKSSTVGAGSYVVKEGDVIEWKLDVINK